MTRRAARSTRRSIDSKRSNWCDGPPQDGSAGRDGLPQRKFVVTPEGVKALRASRKALLELWNGLEDVLAES